MSEATASSVQKRLANHAAVKEIIYTTQAKGPDGVIQTKTTRRKPVTPIYAHKTLMSARCEGSKDPSRKQNGT